MKHVSRTRRFVAIVGIILSVVIFHFVGVLRPVEELLRDIITPGSRALYKASVSLQEAQNDFSSVAELEEAYYALLAQKNAFVVTEAKLKLLEDENAQLRSELSFFEKQDIQYVGAHVAGKNIDPLGNSIVIDVGSVRGVNEGDAVMMEEGVLVGVVRRVNKESAVVRLLTDPQSKVGATVLNTERSMGLVEGGYGISVRMNFVPQHEIISIDDIIVTSGLDEKIPRGLVIGKIEAVEKEAYEPFQRAVLLPTADLENLAHVFVLTNANTYATDES